MLCEKSLVVTDTKHECTYGILHLQMKNKEEEIKHHRSMHVHITTYILMASKCIVVLIDREMH